MAKKKTYKRVASTVRLKRAGTIGGRTVYYKAKATGKGRKKGSSKVAMS